MNKKPTLKENKTTPSLDEIIKQHPSPEEEINLDYEDDDEEEELDTCFPLSEAESKYYDEEGNFYPDGYESEDEE
jgi:hypothetical protein